LAHPLPPFYQGTEELRRELQALVKEKGQVLTEEFLRVDSFLNHCIDSRFVTIAASIICQAFRGQEITCVLTPRPRETSSPIR